jgi:hypothetical protein
VHADRPYQITPPRSVAGELRAEDEKADSWTFGVLVGIVVFVGAVALIGAGD